MSIRELNEVREATLPPYCSACHGQPPGKYVNFDADCDRGFYEGPDGIRIQMDNLIMCEGCVKRACNIVGFEDGVPLRAENEKLRRQAEADRKARRKAEEYAARLEDVFDNREHRIEIPHRLKPRERA